MPNFGLLACFRIACLVPLTSIFKVGGKVGIEILLEPKIWLAEFPEGSNWCGAGMLCRAKRQRPHGVLDQLVERELNILCGGAQFTAGRGKLVKLLMLLAATVLA
jgi:hypothetical protein